MNASASNNIKYPTTQVYSINYRVRVAFHKNRHGDYSRSGATDDIAHLDLRSNTRMQHDRFARKIVGILAPSYAARSRRLMRNPLGVCCQARSQLTSALPVYF